LLLETRRTLGERPSAPQARIVVIDKVEDGNVGTKPQLRSADYDKSLDEVDWFRINLSLIEHNK
jgi:hypothetical protein